jgi:hypothetical protein
MKTLLIIALAAAVIGMIISAVVLFEVTVHKSLKMD